MRSRQRLLLEQLNTKMDAFKAAAGVPFPKRGWINLIRTSLNMTLEQLSNRLGMSRQGAQKIEERELSGNISINTLSEVGRAMNMELVYGFVPKGGSIEALISTRAREVAKEIVLRTSHNMKLENQSNSEQRIQKAIEELAFEIKNEMRKVLWD
ncbi:MAG: mobile mystery protein A [Cytophagia bacterium]|nr:mobile mystery protein A [Cytophagia bacterium]